MQVGSPLRSTGITDPGYSCRHAFVAGCTGSFGRRGNGVRLIRSMRAALEYLQSFDAPVIVQRYVAGPREAGVFYYCVPHESRGHIFAITEKIFPTITGDGIRSVEELIRTDERAALMAR